MLTGLTVHSVRSRKLGDVSVPHSLRLKSLKLRNFKGIAELNLPLDESLTLLAGVNGVGKTSVIQALVAAVTHTWWQFSTHKYPFFRLSDDVARTEAAERTSCLNFRGASCCLYPYLHASRFATGASRSKSRMFLS